MHQVISKTFLFKTAEWLASTGHDLTSVPQKLASESLERRASKFLSARKPYRRRLPPKLLTCREIRFAFLTYLASMKRTSVLTCWTRGRAKIEVQSPVSGVMTTSNSPPSHHPSPPPLPPHSHLPPVCRVFHFCPLLLPRQPAEKNSVSSLISLLNKRVDKQRASRLQD